MATRHRDALENALKQKSLNPSQRGLIRTQLSDINKQLEEYHSLNQPYRTGLPKIDVGETLDRVGDYNRGREEIKGALNQFQNEIGPEYKTAKDAMNAAEERAESGKPEDISAFEDAQKKLDDVISASGAKPELKTALKVGWRNYYGMAKGQQLLDQALSGSPGTIRGSQGELSLDGKKGLNMLNQWIRNPKYGRSGVAQALGGEDRLQALQGIFQKAYTPKGSQMLSKAVTAVARITGGAIGSTVGWSTTGSPVGAATGYGLGSEAAVQLHGAAKNVMKAVLTNPKVSSALLWAIDSGAKVENYAPMIGRMIAEASRQQQPEEEDSHEQTGNDGKTD